MQEQYEVVEGGAALGDPPQAEPQALYDDCVREVLSLLNVRQQCVASCVCKRYAHTEFASTTHGSTSEQLHIQACCCRSADRACV